MRETGGRWWSDNDRCDDFCPICLAGATHLDPHVEGGGNDPSQWVQAAEVVEDDGGVQAQLDVIQLFYYVSDLFHSRLFATRSTTKLKPN